MHLKQLNFYINHLRLNHSVIVFIIVVASHCLAVFALAQMNTNIATVVSIPVIQGALLSAPMPIAQPEKIIPPKPENQKNKKLVEQKIENNIEPQKKIEPAANENTITSPQEPEPPQIAPQTETPEPEPELEPMIIPPRMDAHNLDNPPPSYPRISRRLNESGTVVLEILILPNGRVAETRLKNSSGFERLDNAALQAVKHWFYTPAKRGDEAISFWYLQPVTFTLH